ncbi:hypothetical protein OG453_07050 [Streptomyces sp. NBC_01381]|uniref:hypothetical protein n=1 Tax=Streptomyces sp. NBC_01381 TaxID=2903845 RepID=UPI002257AC27|nr:hypothetical protein [Streptomyces sp. NBC_01381]MCX4666425.1 hypothetical protein [Streptomyces sp. NBC_01381]
MSILRRHLTTGFTVLPTATLEDSRLSFRARGILAYLIAKPDSWKVRTESIAQAGVEGRDAVREAVKELKTLGYYRVENERNNSGHIISVTEVYDTAQEWVAKEYADKEARRIAHKVKRKLEQENPAETDDGFPGVGSPVAGSPVAGGSGGIGSNQSKYPEKNPPTPAAEATGEPADAGGEAAALVGPSCPAHPEGPGSSCRGCGTSPRQQRQSQQRAEKERCKAAERASNERVLAEVRQRPDADGLSDVAVQRIAEMRAVRGRPATAEGSGERPTRHA